MMKLLSPAGDLQKLIYAVRYGADAVYLGGTDFSMRANAGNFTDEDLTQGIKYAHDRGVSVNVAINVAVHNHDILNIINYTRRIVNMGVDGLIVSDPGVIDLIKNEFPEMFLTLSTQANTTNYQSLNFWKKNGINRVVLARELTFQEIKEICVKKPKDMEVEVFVHGAMCMSYSGRCLLSAFLTNRSGNRGDCAQSCRWMYHLCEEKRPGEFFPIEEDENGTAILSSQDLNCMEFVNRLIDAGVCSLKIEGRMKSPYYVASVTNAYRKRLDGYEPIETLERELHSVSHRPYSNGFYFGKMSEFRPDNGVYIRDCTFVGSVIEEQKDGMVKIEQRNCFAVGETLEVIRPEGVGESFTAKDIRNENGESVDRANKAKEIYFVNCPLPLKVGDMIRTRQKEYEGTING